MALVTFGRNCNLLLFGPALLLAACGHTEAGSTGSATTSTPPSPTAIVVSVSPLTATVPAGGAQLFTATVTGSGSASTNVTWNVNGIAGGNAALGTIVTSGSLNNASTGTYTAPVVPPSPPAVTVTATSTADDSKSASATVTITCANSNLISPAAVSVLLGQTQSFTASLCVASGTPITWDVNGAANGSAFLGTIVVTSPNTALYTAPTGIPPEDPVTIHATANPSNGVSVAASAMVTLTSNVSIGISPPTATVAPNQRISFVATILNTSDTSVTWTVNGVTNGNDALGQICVTQSIPCAAPSSPAAAVVDYLAPGSPPSTNPVMLTAISHADPSRSATALVSIMGPPSSVSVVISPRYAFLAPSTGAPSTLEFLASVTGSANTSVSWSVQSGVPGMGCGGAACGSISASGVYAAPSIAPSPNAIAVTATSMADATKSASAMIAIISGPAIETILPSSAFAGAVESFPFAVTGVGFTAGSGSSSSVILINGTPRSTSCTSATSCATVVNPSDVQTAGTITIQIENPGSPGALSNPVPFIVQAADNSPGAISLTSSEPVAAAADIFVVEPTTAASSSPANVDFVGYLTGGNTCGIQGSPLVIVRPVAGAATTSICVHGTGLAPTFTYAFTGPGFAAGNSDIGVTASAITGLLPNMIELDLQLSSSTLPGVRTLFITSLNDDRAVASGMLEVK